MKFLTIFTPTYNRAYILPKLYHSLCNEPSDSFVWLIVDDGSTDDTQELVENWQREDLIEIVFFKQENGGKMRAHNKGVELCTTPLFFCIDSDDQIALGAVKKIIDTQPALQKDDSLSGLIAKKLIINRLVSDNLPQITRSTLHNIYRTGFKGDTSLVFKTDVLREFPFPEIDGEKFITEGYVYDQIDQKYELLIVNEFLMRCEYREDGYTANASSLYLKYPKGWALYFSQYYRFYANTIRDKIKYMGYYVSMCFTARVSISKMFHDSPSWLLCLISIPAGIKFYKRFIRNASNK